MFLSKRRIASGAPTLGPGTRAGSRRFGKLPSWQAGRFRKEVLVLPRSSKCKVPAGFALEVLEDSMNEVPSKM